jgi:acetyltransferase-like isoleucine patch superfamily enzyme
VNNAIKLDGEPIDLNFAELESIKTLGNGLSICNHGNNNKIDVGSNVVFNSLSIQINANNCYIQIGSNCRLSGRIIMKIADGNAVYFGNNVSVGGANFICSEQTQITIGDNCMIAWGIEFRTTDSHAIFDLTSHARINHAEDILIEPDVWIGAHSTILKGAIVRRGSVVAIKSLVVSKFDEPSVILGGTPAKILKRNVYWDRMLLG